MFVYQSHVDTLVTLSLGLEIHEALDPLNAERFPLHGKGHGGFKNRSVKNLAEDLLQNGEQN